MKSATLPCAQPLGTRPGRRAEQSLYVNLMTPASGEPVSWHAATRDANRYRIMSDMAIYRQFEKDV
jgi:hypothetical protein